MEATSITALTGHYRALRRLYLVYLAAAVLALVLFFFNKYLTFAVLAASLVYHFAFLRPRAKAYERAYVHACIQHTLEQHLHDPLHTAEATLTPEALRRARLVADNNGNGSILIREGGRGTWKNGEVRLGDVTFAHSFPMEGKTHHEFVTGCWVTVDLGRDTGLRWRLLSRKVMMPASRDPFYRVHGELKLLREGGPAWTAEDYLTFLEGDTALPGDAFYAALRKLAEYSPGAMAVCVDGPTLHLFLTNRLLGMQVSVREEPVEARVNFDLLPELGHLLRAAELL